MSSTVGEVKLKLSFDSKSISTEQNKVQKEVAAGWTKTGATIANLASNAVSSAVSAMTSRINSAISRVDTLNNFPKIMSNLGISTADASTAINEMSNHLQGLPTTLDSAASAVQNFTSKNGDVLKSKDYFLALNDALLAGGQSTEIQSSALEQLSQAYAKGKPDMMEWRSLMTAMPAQLNQVAQAMGYGSNNAAALGEDLRSGKVSMDDFMNAIVQLDKEGANGFLSFAEQAKTATGGINTALSVMGSRISQGVAEAIDAIGAENIANMATSIGNALKGVGQAIANVINFVKENKDWIIGLVSAIGFGVAVFKGLVAVLNLVKIAQIALNAVMAVNPIFLLVTAIASLIIGLTVFFTQTETGKQIMQAFGEVVGAVFGAIGQWFSNLFQWFSDLLNGIGNFFSTIFGWFNDTINNIVGGVQNFFATVTGIFGAIGSWIYSNVIAPIGGFFEGLWNGIVAGCQAVGNVIGGIFGAIVGIIKAPINGIISGINAVIDMINSIEIPEWVPFIGGAHLEIGHVPYLAQGGFAVGATTAVIGEAGKEAVLPLESNTGNWSGLLADTLLDAMSERNSAIGGGIVVNMSNNINSELDADSIGIKMINSIRRASL